MIVCPITSILTWYREDGDQEGRSAGGRRAHCTSGIVEHLHWVKSTQMGYVIFGSGLGSVRVTSAPHFFSYLKINLATTHPRAPVTRPILVPSWGHWGQPCPDKGTRCEDQSNLACYVIVGYSDTAVRAFLIYDINLITGTVSTSGALADITRK